MAAARSLSGSVVFLRALTVLSSLFWLYEANASAGAGMKSVAIRDLYGLSGYVKYSEGCTHEFAIHTLENCQILISVPEEEVIPYRVPNGKYFGFLDYLRLSKTVTRVTFSTVAESTPSGTQKKYRFLFSNDDPDKPNHAFNLDAAHLPDALHKNMLLTLITLALRPCFQLHYSLNVKSGGFQRWVNYLPPYDTASPTTPNLQGLRENEVVVYYEGIYSLGFTFDPTSQTPVSVVLHDKWVGESENEGELAVVGVGLAGGGLSLSVVAMCLCQGVLIPGVAMMAAGVVLLALLCNRDTPQNNLILETMRATEPLNTGI